MPYPPLLTRQQKLTFPNRNPGFDPTHIASVGLRIGRGISIVPTASAGAVSLLSGQVGTRPGTAPTSGTDSRIGPFVSFASTARFSFAGQSTTANTSITYACFIINSSTAANENVFLNSGATNTGTVFRVATSTANIVFLTSAATNVFSAGPLTTNIPYFLAASANNATFNMVQVNLNTAQLKTFTGAVTNAVSEGVPTGTYVMGSGATGGAPFTGKLGPLMWSPSYHPLQDLILWADDPWAFWYPRNSVIDSVGWLASLSHPPPIPAIILMGQICL